jgi:hypothetical protein
MAPVEMTKFVVIGESEQQIPGGNDRKKSEGRKQSEGRKTSERQLQLGLVRKRSGR